MRKALEDDARGVGRMGETGKKGGERQRRVKEQRK